MSLSACSAPSSGCSVCADSTKQTTASLPTASSRIHAARIASRRSSPSLLGVEGTPMSSTARACTSAGSLSHRSRDACGGGGGGGLAGQSCRGALPLTGLLSIGTSSGLGARHSGSSPTRCRACSTERARAAPACRVAPAV